MNKEHLKKIDDVLKEMVDTGYAAGGNILILENGKEVYYSQAGFRDVENGVPFDRDTIIRLYSMSKPITGAAAMLLIEDGLLDIDAPVGDYIESFRNQTVADRWNNVPVKRPARIRDLLNMSAGITYNGCLNRTEVETCPLVDDGVSRIGTDNEMTTMELAERIGAIPLKFSPGEEYNYSFCADVMGAVIEKVSGMRFGEFLKKRFFEPLGMKDTDFYVPAEKQSRLSKVYKCDGGKVEEFFYNNLIINLKMDHAPAFESGGAGLATTLDDYAKFATMLMNGGIYEGKRIMQPKTVEFFTTASMEDLPRESYFKSEGNNGNEYANYLQIMKDATRSVTVATNGEYGWDGWLGPYFRNDPVHKVTMLLGLQRTDTGTTTYTKRLRNVVFSSIEE
ncbi:MAG: beta-lactamase family protein [Lachnospiraceae bacterium]|nr:beta-lactamase family protein [Lachnospiraceae bacterium]